MLRYAYTVAISCLTVLFTLGFSIPNFAKAEESVTQPRSEGPTHGGIFHDSVLSSVTNFDPVKTLDVATLRVGQQLYQTLVEILGFSKNSLRETWPIGLKIAVRHGYIVISYS